ncbi:MAG: DciA family protein [Bacteroidota bacterium]
MRRSETLNISEIIASLLKQQGLEDKLYENRLMNNWEELLGKSIAKATRHMYIKEQVLFVQITSSVVKHEIMMIRGDLVKRLNEKVGKKVIDKIVVR